jgi:RNA polymerase subunit RPABC4/transcription elongation factor Spt4
MFIGESHIFIFMRLSYCGKCKKVMENAQACNECNGEIIDVDLPLTRWGFLMLFCMLFAGLFGLVYVTTDLISEVIAYTGMGVIFILAYLCLWKEHKTQKGMAREIIELGHVPEKYGHMPEHDASVIGYDNRTCPLCKRPNFHEAKPMNDASPILVFRVRCDECLYNIPLYLESTICFAIVLTLMLSFGIIFVHYLPDGTSFLSEVLFFVVLLAFLAVLAISSYFMLVYLFLRSRSMEKYMDFRIKKKVAKP